MLAPACARVDLGRTPGAAFGGLPIVRDISKLYGGGLELQQSPLGGLSAVLDLPAIG